MLFNYNYWNIGTQTMFVDGIRFIKQKWIVSLIFAKLAYTYENEQKKKIELLLIKL